MTTPSTKSYNDARWAAVKKFETTGKPDTAFYLDGSGFVTIGYGTLVTKKGATQPYASAVVSNSSDPVLAQKMVDAFAGSSGDFATTKTSLEKKGFVFDDHKIIGFKDGTNATGEPIVLDIKNVLSEAGATQVIEVAVFPEKEQRVDDIEALFKTPFTEEQRAAVLSRVFNGVPRSPTIDALAKEGTPEAALAFFASNRGGPNGANPGHYARTIEEAREFLGNSVQAATVGNATGFTYTDKEGNEVFIGSQSQKIGAKTDADFVAYKVVTNEDQTQTQVPLSLPSLGAKGSMQFVDAAHFPTDPAVAFNNAYLSGDPVKLLSALTLDPAIKSPQAALDALGKYAPELGELQDVNLGTDGRPIWAKGYVTTDDDGRTTILAVSKDSKGKAALVGYEIDAPTEADPNPQPHALQVTAPQSKIPALKISDSGEIGDAVASADPNTDIEPSDGFSASVVPVALHQLDIDGQTYAVNANGTLQRPVAGNPGWVELRDSTGGGVIVDRDGEVVAQLQPGDRVGMMDDGRITINDNAGSSVNRTVDETQAGAFYQHMGSDAVFNAAANSTSNQPPASVEYVPNAPETITDASTQNTAIPSNPNNFSAYLSGPGASLTPAQQDALATQLDGLGLGGDANLSFYALPDGGVLIGNAEGDIVGEINHSASGDLNLRATSLNAQGSAGTLSTHIGEDGGALSDLQYSQYQASQLSAGLGLVNSLGALQNWEGMNDLGHLSTVVGLYNNLGTLSNGGTSALGDLGGAASVLGLISAIDSGNGLAMLQSGLQVTQMGLNLYSNMMASSLVDAASSAAFDAAAESALSSAAASSVIGEALPYVGALMALDNFDAHPFQSIGAIAGMYFGPIGSMLGSMIGGLIDSFLGGDTPPPPAGSTHYDWDADGNIQIRVDQNISGGGDAASQTAHGLQDLLNTIVKSINDQNPDSADNVALNPYLLPKVGFSGNSAWIETTAPGGAPVRESVHSDTIAQRLLEVMTGNGALAPAWQVQSQLVQHQTLVASGASAADISATLGAGAGGHAAAGNQAYAIQGLASESADFKTQSFGALVLKVHASATVQSSVAALDQHLQDSQVQTSQIYKNTDADAYLEKTQWVSATDAQGNAQGILVLDFNGNGAIETQDLLNLGGNAGQGGNQTDEAARATANTANQHNNAQWLDANSDGVLNASDPAFAAIKLWVDVNQDGVMQAGEGQALAAQVQSININTGEVTYSDGSSAAIAATTLQSDTSGVKLTQLMQVDADGKLVALDAGTFVEHEGYEGQVQVSDDAGTRWGKVSKQTYEQDAKRTGDWEGTAEQDAHRHGGGNVAGTPTETSVTSVTGMGPVRGINQVTYATLQEGDARVVSDALTQAAPRQPNAQTVINAGDIRIKSAAAPASATPPRPPSPTLAFVPMGGASAQNEVRLMTAQMMESAQTSPFGLGGAGGMGLGVLAGVGLGMVQTTAFAVAPATQFTYAETQSAAAHGLVPETTMEVVRATVTEATPRPGSGASTADVLDNNTATTIVFRQVNLGTLRSVSSANSPVGTARDTQEAPQLRVMLSPGSTDSTGSNRGSTDTSATQDTPSGNTHSNSSGSAGVTTSVTNSAPTSSVTAAPVMLAPTVRGEVLQGSEDVAYRLDASVLLANDSSFMSGLSITGVGLASHGRVSLVNGVIIFVPDANFHGTASFEYTVSDAYGLSSTSTAVLETVTVNDAPVALGEQTQGEEDIGLIFTQADLLANDSDVDTATDGQTLRISSVGDALHGTVWLDAGGAVRFVPDANYHGPAQFTYWVDDGAGAQTAATVQLTVAAVNDAPRTRDEQAQGVEDTGLLFSQADLLANDTDVDTATDGQVLRISSAGDALHGVVSIDANGDLRFMPDANYHGPAQFTYWVDDGNGGRAPATVNLTISGVNDVPVATDDLAQGYEDIGLIFTQIQLLANDIDPDVATDGQVLQITRVEQAQHGVVWMDANGDLRFVPDANYHGPAQFTYWMTDGESDPVSATVHLTVLAVNDLPVTLGETGSSDEDVTLVFDPATLLGNDSDVDTATDGQVLSISAVGNATHGTVALVAQNGAQRIEFTPEANFFGVASYEYTVSDGAGGNVQTTVMLNLAPVNDAPTAVNDSLQGMDEDAALHISLASLLGNDTDADAHNSQWGGTDDTFALHAVGNATHGTVAIVAGEVVFTPDANYNGPASFAYQVSDGSGALSQAVATFDIASVEDAPIAVAETIAANEDETLLINPAALLANDIDPDVATNGEVLSITGVNHAMHGTVSTHADGQIEFVPDADFFGAASFDYTMTDGHGGMSSTTTVIQVANVDDAPIATGETINSFEDQVLNLRAALVANEVDIDNTHAELGISRVQVNSGGSAYVTGNGDLIFTPDANYSGTASFTYWVRDPAGLESNPVTATLQIAEVNDAPVAQGEYLTGASEDAAFHISRAQLLANDYDVDGPNSALHLSSIGNATNGTVAQDANGDMVFTPNANFNGTASFSYRVTDDQGAQSDAVQVVIPVAAVNDVPVVVDDQFQTLRNTDMTIAFNQLIGNDTDADGDALTVGGVRNASNGAVSIANGDVHFSANNNFVGQASFEYQADDGHGAQAWATAFVNVNAPVNLYPTISLSADQTHDVWYGISAYYNAVEVWQDFSYTINDESPGSVSISIIPTNGGNVEPGATFNSFQFHKYDPWGADGVQLGFDIVMTDANGAVNTDHVALEFDLGAIGHPINYFTQSHDHPAGTYTSPVVLALGADSPSYLNTQLSKVSYDINIDGVADTVAWAAPGSGVLGIDLNGDHQISDTSEFAFKQYVEGAQTDLEGLKAFDTNRNVMLDTGDTQWSQFGVWEDKNADGTTQDGEYQSLDALGISSIDLKSDGQMHNAGTPLEPGGEASADVVVFGTASYTRTDGSTGAAQDAMFAYQDGAQALPAPELLSTSDAQEAELNRQVLQFNQMCNTAVDATSEPLGFVPIAPDLYATASFPDMFQAMNDPVLTVDNTNTQLLAA